MTPDVPSLAASEAERRRRMLSRLREVLPQALPLPSLDEQWIRFEDPAAQFAETLAFVGGKCETAPTLAAALDLVAQTAPAVEAKRTYSWFDGFPGANVAMEAIEDPHSLADVDMAVLPGRMAVAENAAVWATEQGLRHRVILFLTQHLALIVPRARLVDNLHEAYGRLSFETSDFGVWISGPSKTADIEQSLVIGAHGARSLTVVLTDEDFLGQ
ncbi:MAG TPA: LUD domain-containing protein [Pirellulaceae bacterium]|nr:LUD domain-containing protein [Pirellulaceae bacterium]